MNSLIKASINNRVFSNLLAIFLVVAGLSALQGITVRLFPDIQLESISITVPYPGATPEEVEDSVIKPIEQQIEGLEGVRKISSLAAENVGNVIVSLDSGEDIYKRLDDIKTEIDQITVFPLQAEDPQITEVKSDELTTQFVFYGDVASERLKREADRFRTLLIDSSAISDVRIEGVAEYMIDIEVSESTLRQYGLSLPAIAQLVRQQSLDLSGGEIEGNNRRLLVRTIGENKLGNEFGDIVLTTGTNGAKVRLRDIATIRDGLSDDPIAGFYNGVPAVALGVFRVGDEQVFESVEAALSIFEEKIKPTLPDGIEAVVWRNESTSLSGRIDLLIKNALIGVLLVGGLLLLFLDIRIAFWVAIGVAVAFVGSFTLLAFSGYTINQISLFGFILAIGIVVDDAVVVGENIYVQRTNGAGEKEAAKKGVTQVSKAVLFSTLTTIAVFIPLLLIPGTYGQFMGPIAAVVIFVLILSLLESFFILPRHLSHLSNNEPSRFSPRRIADPLRNWMADKLLWIANNPVRAGVSFAAHRPIITVLGFVVMFAASLSLLFTGAVKFVFFPEIEGNYVTATVELSERASDAETRRAMQSIEQAAREAATNFKVSESVEANSVVSAIFSTRGATVGGSEPNAATSGGAVSNLGVITAQIEDAGTRTFTALEFENAWRKATGEIPGAQRLVFSSNLVSAGAPVQLEVRSRDEARAKSATGALRDALSGINGVIDARDDRFKISDEVQVRLKPEAQNYGLTLEQLAAEVRSAYFGSEAVRVQRDREEIEVRVRLPQSDRATLESIKNRRIAVNGGYIPIRTIADIEIGDAPSAINRVDGKRVITLSADVDTKVTTGGAVTGQLLNEVWPKISAEYPNVEVGVGGDQEQQARAAPAIARNFGLALFAVFALLAIVFKSYTQPLVIMSIIPFGFMGALLGHAVLGLDLTLLSMFGVIGLSGVVINDGLLLVEFINDRLEEGKERIEAVIDATTARFRPIILTSMTTFLGVTPIILEQSVQAQFLIPTAVSLGVGILFATIILMFLLPAFASIQLGAKAWIRKKLKSGSETENDKNTASVSTS